VDASVHTLRTELHGVHLLCDRLREEFADDPDLASSMIEGETGIHEAIAAAARAVFEDEARLIGLNTMLKILQGRKTRLEGRIELMRAAICEAMRIAHVRSRDYGFCTVSLKPTSATAMITDEAAIPSTFWKAQDPKLDVKGLTTYLRLRQKAVAFSLSISDDAERIASMDRTEAEFPAGPGAQLSEPALTVALKWS
jgi:hypothetical protein